MSGNEDEALALFRAAEGRSVLGVLRQGLASIASAFSVGVTRGTLAILSFLFAPFVIFYDVAIASGQAFLIDPLTGFDAPGLGEVPGILQAGIATSVSGIASLVGTPYAIAGFQISLGVILVGLAVIGLFLSLGFTSDVVPGIFTDNRVYRFFFTTPEEEEEGA